MNVNNTMRAVSTRPNVGAAAATASLGAGASKKRPLDIFFAVLESKKIHFDGATGKPKLKVTALRISDAKLQGPIRALLDKTRREMGPVDNVNQIRGPWSITHEGKRYSGFFHDESQHGRAILADDKGRVLLNQFVLIDG